MAILDVIDVVLETPNWFRSFFEETLPIVLRSTVHPYPYCHNENLYGEGLINIRGRSDIHHLPPIFDADCQTPPPLKNKSHHQPKINHNSPYISVSLTARGGPLRED